MESIMAWTEITRPNFDRDAMRYASDLTDDEWAVVEPLLPARSKQGRPPKTGLRSVIEAILYIALQQNTLPPGDLAGVDITLLRQFRKVFFPPAQTKWFVAG